MRPIVFSLCAAASAFLLLAPAGAATRPRYGGKLRVEMRSQASSLNPAQCAQSPAAERVCALLYERLTELDEHGEPRPSLALAWSRDADTRRWLFRLRPNVRFHDGTAFTSAEAAAALESLGAVAQGDALVFPESRASLDLPRELARLPLARRSGDGWAGTGPFRIAEWDAGRRAQLIAFESHWAGRPFLDALEIHMGRPPREQLVDLELDRADVVEIGPGDLRRTPRVSSSQPVELIAIVFERTSPADPRLREALARAIDRPSIQAVLLQRHGVATASLVPQWLSGYSALFPPARDVARARSLAGAAPRQVSLGYDPTDPLARSLADRVAVNAREAGLTLRPPAGATTDARLVRVRLAATDVREALAQAAGGLDLPPPPAGATPDGLLAHEAALLREFRVIPLFHLPESCALAARVRAWKTLPWGGWRLEDVWLAPERKP